MRGTLALVLGLVIGAVAIGVLSWSGLLPIGSPSPDHDEEGHAHDEHEGHEGEGHEDHEEGQGGARRVRLSARAIEAAKIETAKVARRESVRGLEFSAIVQVNEDRLAHLSTRTAARIEAVSGRVGADVEPGAVLLELDSLELGEAKANYLRLKSTLAALRTNVAEQESLFALLSRLEVQLAAIDFLKAREAHEIARRNYEREKGLFDRGSASEKEMLEALSVAQETESAMNAASQKLVLFDIEPGEIAKLTWARIGSITGRGTTSPKDLLEARAALLETEAEFAAAQERLMLLGLSRGEIAGLEWGEEHAISHFSLKAPIAGRILEKHATLGEVVEPDRVLFTIADLSTVWVIVGVHQKYLPRIRFGADVSIEAEGVTERIRGKVALVSDVLDVETRTAPVRVEVPNESGRLRPGMYVKAIVADPGEAAELQLVVPEEAVQRIEGESVVFVVVGGDEFEAREVLLGTRTAGWVVVEGGLRGGETIVVRGGFHLKSELMRSKFEGHSH